MTNSFDGYIGQQSLVETLKKFLSLPTFPNVFFSATMGSGKTELAQRVANAIGRDFKEVGCRSDLKLDDVIYKLFLTWKDGGVLFLDELPLLSKPNQAKLRTLLESGYFTMESGDSLEFENLTVLAASSDITKVDPDLKDRFEVLEFSNYNMDEMSAIGQLFNDRFETNLDYSVIEKLAFASNFSPRKLRKLIQNSASAVLHSGDKPTIENILETARIDADGMTPHETQVMLKIGEFIVNGVNPTVSRVATALRMPERTLRVIFENLEAYGYVSVSMGPGGRRFTMDGIRKYKEIQP